MTAFRDLHRSGLLILPNAWTLGRALGWGEVNALMQEVG